MYPKVFADFVEHQKKYSDTSILPTRVSYGMEAGEEVSVDIGWQDAHHQVPDGWRPATAVPAGVL